MPSPACLLSPTTCLAAHAAGAAVSSVFDNVAKNFAQGLADVMKALMTFWVNTPDPNVSSSSAVISTLDQLTRPFVAFGAVLGLVVGGTRLVWTARHEQSAQAILRGLLLMTVVTAAGATIVEVLLTGFDALAKAVLARGIDGQSVGDRLTALGELPSVGAGLLFVLAFFGMLASLVQVGIMLVRGAILAVLVGILPVAAGASITEAGYGWFKRLCGWIFSFTVYKLAAAVIYAAAFTMIGNATDLPGIVSGFALLIVAILALPALLRLLPPSAEAMAGGSGGAMAGMVAAGATGAVTLSSRGVGGAQPAAFGEAGLKGGGDSSANGRGGPSGADGTSGRAGGAALPGGSGGGGAGVRVAAGAAARGPAGAAAAAGPAGAAIGVAGQAVSGARSAANGAVGEEGRQ